MICPYIFRSLVCIATYSYLHTYNARFLTEAEPWKMKGADEGRRPAIVRTTLEAIYAFMHFLGPVIPFAAQKVRGDVMIIICACRLVH